MDTTTICVNRPAPSVSALWRQVDSRLRALAKMRAAQLAECQRQLREAVTR